MGKIRSIHPEATESPTLATLPAEAERTFWRLLPHTDDHGRGRYDPLVLRSKLYAASADVTPDMVERDFQELLAAGLVTVYDNDGKRYYHVRSWAEFQKPKYLAESKLPGPTDPGSEPVKAISSPDRPPIVPRSGLRIGEGVGVVGGEEADDESSAPPPEDVEAKFAEFWAAFPPNRGNGKPGGGASKSKTWERFRKLRPTERDACLTGVRHYAADQRRPDAPFPAHATTWLNERRWEDWQEPGRQLHAVSSGLLIDDEAVSF